MNKRHYEHTLPNIRGSLSNTYFPAILYRMKCPYSPANYLKGDYEVRAVTMKEQRTTGGELKKMQYHT